MKRTIAFPFLTLSEAAVDASAWEVSLDGDEWHEAGDFLPDWDPSQGIHIRRCLRLDPEIAARELALPPDDLHLQIGLRVGTGQGRLPRLVIDRHAERLNIEDPIWNFSTVIDARMLSLVLDLQTQITLATEPHAPGPLSPALPGDRLWSDIIRIRLEGEEPRFPIETVDLSRMLGGMISGDAPWYLHWSPRDWNRDFHGAVRLYLNKDATAFIERVEAEDPQTLQLLLADVMSQICERFAADGDLDFDEIEPGTLAAQAATWLRKAWPGKDIEFIRSLLESRPGVFRSAFLALAELVEA